MLGDDERKQNEQRMWDDAAATFDDAPDHGLRDPDVAAAWRALLEPWLPAAPSRVLDIGCGTGSLSLLMGALRHDVTGIDFSPAMIAQAEAKATSHSRRTAHRLSGHGRGPTALCPPSI